ncbi:MAG: hypothetical protein MJA83_05805 [Gammaproteobacteria bacterium]|nr:hypothetical protein [Gammaproteobacteria bacterium]
MSENACGCRQSEYYETMMRTVANNLRSGVMTPGDAASSLLGAINDWQECPFCGEVIKQCECLEYEPDEEGL